MNWKEILLDPVFKWAFLVIGVGAVALVAIQMWRGDALVCSDRSIFAKSCAAPSTQNNQTIPAGAVLALDMTECPTGWEQYERAEGRFIMGAGRYSEYNVYGNEIKPKSVGETGGQEQAKLTIQQMPRHSHANRTKGSGSNPDVPALQATDKGELGGAHKRPTGSAGDGALRHNASIYSAILMPQNVTPISCKLPYESARRSNLLSQLHTWPVRTPVNASPTLIRPARMTPGRRRSLTAQRVTLPF